MSPKPSNTPSVAGHQVGTVTDEDLRALPLDWRFVPVRDKHPADLHGNKDPSGWFDRFQLDADSILELNGNRPEAIGLLLGPVSGVMAVDFDGPGSTEKFLEVTGHSVDDLPRTIAWTSGKPARQQRAFTVPRDWWESLANRRAEKGAGGQVVLEFRWDRHQSVICGRHPETGAYRWVDGCSPQELGDPAEAPEWLLQALLKPEYDDTQQAEPTEADAIEAVAILKHLPPSKFTGYDDWLAVGMALHHVGVDVGHWIEWSRGMASFDEAECHAKWRSFDKPYKGRKRGLGSLRSWGGANGYHHRRPEPPRPRPELLEGIPQLALTHRLLELNQGRSGGAQGLLLSDAPGTGKSRLVAPLADALLATDQVKLVIYCSPDYRSPSIPELRLWAEVKTRHNGIEEYVVNSTRKLRRKQQGSGFKVVETPSCLISDKLGSLRTQGLSSGHEAAICRKCVYRPTCKYVHEQMMFAMDMKKGAITRLRCSIESLPAVRALAGDDLWAQTVVIIDEAPQLLNACAKTWELSYKTLKAWTYDISWGEGQEKYRDKPLLIQLLDALIKLPEHFKKLDQANGGASRHVRFGFDLLQLADYLQPWRKLAVSLHPSWLQEAEVPTVDLNGDEAKVLELLLLPRLVQAAAGD